MQVNCIADFFATHEWAGPIVSPLYLHRELDVMTERYVFDCYIDLRRAKENYESGNFEQAKKDLALAIMCKGEAYDIAFYNNALNNFTTMLFDKTEKLLDKALEIIFADECPSQNNDWAGFCNFKNTLVNQMM